MTRADRLTLVRQLRDQGLSQRAIGKRLHVSKDTVRRDLERLDTEAAPDSAPLAQPDSSDAPQASEGEPEDSAPGGAPQRAPVVNPLAGIDVSRCAGLRHDLALLAQTGTPVEGLVYQAVIAMAHAYKQALARGDLQPGVPFMVREVRLTPLPHRAVGRVPAEAG